MTPIRFNEQNHTMGPPPGLPEGACRPLPCYVNADVCVSVWEPTPRERAMIAAGANLSLCVFLQGRMVPVLLSAENLFEPAQPDADRLAEVEAGGDCCRSCQHFRPENSRCARWDQETTWFRICEAHWKIALCPVCKQPYQGLNGIPTGAHVLGATRSPVSGKRLHYLECGEFRITLREEDEP